MDPRPSRRAALIGAGAAAVLGVGVPWTISAVRDDPPHPGPANVAPEAGPRVADRQGAAYQLLSATALSARVNPAAARPVAATEQAFSLALLRCLDVAENLAVSPASVAVALAMLQNGARGTTLDQMRAALQSAKLSVADTSAGWAALTDAWSSAANSGSLQLSSANSLWTQSGLPMQPRFMAALRRWFGAGVWQVNFAGDTAGAVDAINAWTSEHTHGRIPTLLDNLPRDTQAVLANAIYFKAAWQSQFDAHDTNDGQFTTESGPITASFMSAQLSTPTVVTPDYSAVQLPYRGARFAALAIMPRRGTLADLVAGLTPTGLQQIVGTLQDGPLSLRMPRFAMSTTLDLSSALQALGMTAAFTDDADFSALSSDPLKLSKVIQRVYLSVAEKGTEAAAATGIVMVPLSAVVTPTVVELDHPFLFLIRDIRTGAILFAAKVQHPRF